MNVGAINDLLGITEGYQLPDKLLQVLEANEHGAIWSARSHARRGA